MKYLLILFLLISTATLYGPSAVVVYDETSKRVIAYYAKTNPHRFDGRTDVLINPDLSALRNVSRKYWEYHKPLLSAAIVREMNQTKKDAVDQEISDAAAARTAKRDAIKAKLLGAMPTLTDEEIDSILSGL